MRGGACRGAVLCSVLLLLCGCCCPAHLLRQPLILGLLLRLTLQPIPQLLLLIRLKYRGDLSLRLRDLPLPLCRLRLLPPIKRGLRERERGVRVWLLAWLWLLLLLYTSFAASSASLACCICSCSASSCRTFLMCAMLGSSIFVSLPFSSSWYLCRAGRREGGG